MKGLLLMLLGFGLAACEWLFKVAWVLGSFLVFASILSYSGVNGMDGITIASLLTIALSDLYLGRRR